MRMGHSDAARADGRTGEMPLALPASRNPRVFFGLMAGAAALAGCGGSGGGSGAGGGGGGGGGGQPTPGIPLDPVLVVPDGMDDPDGNTRNLDLDTTTAFNSDIREDAATGYSATVGGQSLGDAGIGLSISSDGRLTGYFVGDESVRITITAISGSGMMEMADLVIDVNRPPVVKPNIPAEVDEIVGEPIEAINVADFFSDPNTAAGDNLTYSVTAAVNGSDTQLSALGITFRNNGIEGALVASDGEMDTPDAVLAITATDSKERTAEHTLTIIANDKPVDSESPLMDRAAMVGAPIDSIDVRVGFDDPDGEDDELEFAVTFSPSDGSVEHTLEFDTDRGAIAGRVDSPGMVTVTVAITDEGGAGYVKTFTITATEPATNAGPAVDTETAPVKVVLTPGDGEANLPLGTGEWFTGSGGGPSFSAVLADGSMLSSVGLNINTRNGEIAGLYTGSGGETVVVTAMDAGGLEATHRFIIALNTAPGPGTTPLRGTTVIETTGAAITPINLNTAFIDIDAGATLMFAATAILDGEEVALSRIGLTIENDDHIRGMFTAVADVDVTVTAVDDNGAEFAQTFTIMANARPGTSLDPLDPAGERKELNSLAGAEITPFRAGDGFADPDGDDLTFSATAVVNGREVALSEAGLGTLEIDSMTGVITGAAPLAPGETTVTVTAGDGHVDFAQNFTLVVGVPGDTTLLEDEVGTNGTNRLTGGDGKQWIRGLGGNDTLVGGAGDDTIEGGAGNDTIHGHTAASLGPDTDMDTAVYLGVRAGGGYMIESGLAEVGGRMTTRITVIDAMPNAGGDDGTDTLLGIERIRFADGTLELSSLLKVMIGTPSHASTTGDGNIVPIDLASWFMAGSGGALTFGGLDTLTADTGLMFDSGTNMISGAPNAQEVSFTVTATEAGATGVSAKHTYTIGGNTRPVESTTNPLPDIPVMAVTGSGITPIELRDTFTDADSDMLTITVTGLPPGLRFNPAREQIVGNIPHASAGSPNAGTTTVTVTASDGRGGVATGTFEIEATDANLIEGAPGNIVDTLKDTSTGASRIRGLGGDDTITGGVGDDTIHGGEGDDTAVYLGDQSEYRFERQRFVMGTEIVEIVEVNAVDAATDGVDTLRSIENLRFSDSMGNDAVIADLDLDLAEITGDGGDNNGMNDTFALAGDDDNQTIRGLGGNDRLQGGGGNDILDGGEDDDTVVYLGYSRDFRIMRETRRRFVLRDEDTVNAGDEGEDTLTDIETIEFLDRSILTGNIQIGGGSPRTLDGHPTEANFFHGTSGGHTFIGGGGGDIFQFLSAMESTTNKKTTISGWDSASGDYIALADIPELRTLEVDATTTAGVTTLSHATSGFVLDVMGTHPNLLDFVYYIGAANEHLPRLLATDEVDILFGTARGDTIDARGGGDTVSGGMGDDTIDGGSGDDTIDGGAGMMDTAVYAADRANYRIWRETVGGVPLVIVLDRTDGGGLDEGRDTLSDIEFLDFNGTPVPLANFSGPDATEMFDTPAPKVTASAPETIDFALGEADLAIDVGDWFEGGDSSTLRYDAVGSGLTDAGLTLNSETGLIDVSGVAVGNVGNHMITIEAGDVEDQTYDDVTHTHIFRVTEGADPLVGGGANDTLTDDTSFGRTIRGGAGDDRLTGGAGNDIIDGGPGNGDTAVYLSGIRDYSFRLHNDSESVIVTDANTAGNDEGTDIVRTSTENIDFGGTVIPRIGIQFGTGNTLGSADASEPQIFSGLPGSTFIGGMGADIFQFLTAAASSASSTTIIRGFDPASDRIALADIDELRGITQTPNIDTEFGAGGQVTSTTLRDSTTGFTLRFEGVGQTGILDSIYYIGAGPRTSVSAPHQNAFRSGRKEEIAETGFKKNAISTECPKGGDGAPQTDPGATAGMVKNFVVGDDPDEFDGGPDDGMIPGEGGACGSACYAVESEPASENAMIKFDESGNHVFWSMI